VQAAVVWLGINLIAMREHQAFTGSFL